MVRGAIDDEVFLRRQGKCSGIVLIQKREPELFSVVKARDVKRVASSVQLLDKLLLLALSVAEREPIPGHSGEVGDDLLADLEKQHGGSVIAAAYDGIQLFDFLGDRPQLFTRSVDSDKRIKAGERTPEQVA